MHCKGNCETEASRILLGQASCPGAPVWVPCRASPCPEVEVPILGGGEDVGGRRPLTSSTHLTDPRWVRRGAGPALRAGGGGRSHVRALGALCLGQAWPSLVSSAPRLRACSVPERPRQKAGCGRDGRWGTADRAHLPPRGEPWGHGAPGGLRAGRATVAGGAGRKRRAPSLAARRESDELMDSSQKYVYMHHCLPELARWVGIRSSAALPQPGRRPPGGPTAAPPCPALLPFTLAPATRRISSRRGRATHPPLAPAFFVLPTTSFL